MFLRLTAFLRCFYYNWLRKYLNSTILFVLLISGFLKRRTESVAIYLVVVRGSTKGKEFQLEAGENLIGRWDPDNGSFPEIDLEADDPEAKVSRKHAVIFCSEQGVFLEDIGSRNGTYLNRGTRLNPGDRKELQNGDELVVGKTILRLEVR